MSNEVFNDVKKCDECESSFLLATESADHIEGKPNPDINDETYEGLFCYECISKLETMVHQYNPKESEYELAKDNKLFLVIWGDGYGDTPPENEWVESFDGFHIETKESNDYVINNFEMQRKVLFKEIELAEEWDLDEEFLINLWNAKENEWNTYFDLSGNVFFKCINER